MDTVKNIGIVCGISGVETISQKTRLAVKFLKVLFLVIFLFALFACGNNNNGGAPPVSFQLNSDSYNTFGNTSLEVGVLPAGTIAVRINGSVLDNDTGTGLTVTGVIPGTGVVTMNPDGTFAYEPATGLLGVDTFSYEVTDGTDSASADVTITIDNRVWYVDNSGTGTQGTSIDPFSTLSDAQSVAQSGDTIYLSGDGSSSGMDQGLLLTTITDISVIGAGVPLIINGIDLASAGTIPVITNTGADNVLNLDTITNAYIAGLTIDTSVADAVLINNSSGITLQDMLIQNSGESAIEGVGAAIDLSLVDVSIVNSDQDDSSTSDDAIYLHPTASVILTMTGGLIDVVPGNLGDGIVLLNADSATQVDMLLTVQGVSLSNIGQDAIKVDNENGLIIVQIGGSVLDEGNDLSNIGYRGIVINSDGDPDSATQRTNSVVIDNNIIASNHEAIQIRGIDDITQLTVTNNTVVSTATTAIVTSAIDLQHDFSAQSQARIDNNTLNGNGIATDTGLRVRLFDGASLAVQANNNTLDTFDTGFELGARETTALDTSSLNATITDNQLLNITLPDLAMHAVNYHVFSETCLDLRNNSAVSDYVVEIPAGVFNIAIGSQTINLLSGTITGTPFACQLPSF